ncbi:MAG: AraC family transcriptional regulator [Bacteroidales bacterium]|nr:AraC family transcriptional regulator [Bacteroidales bacterium]
MENSHHRNIESDCHPRLQNPVTDTVKGHITLMENPGQFYEGNYPVKLKEVIAVICEKGTMEGTVNLRKFMAESPCIFIALSGQILQFETFSDNFRGLTLIMSQEFWDGFPFDNSLEFPLSRSIRDNPSIALEQEELDSMKEFFRLMQKTIRKEENPNRSEAVKYLTMALFYGFGYQFHKINEELNRRNRDRLVENFLLLVRENYREHREMEFYAGKLNLTPKYLSKAIRQKSGKTGSEWIEDHVMLEARALLKSTDKSISQISDELNFPSQSFFGKYFKRLAGLSPMQYRKRK